MTPESSEAPRESLTGIPVEDREAFIFGNADKLLKGNALYQSVNLSGKVPAQGHSKTSSPELASLAAKYVNMDDAEMAAMFEDENGEYPSPFLADVRRLAASVLAQAEGTPRK